MTYRVIRVSADYGVVVVVSPEDAKPSEPEKAKFYLHDDLNQIGDEKNPFVECSFHESQMYFSGHADGFGWGDRPIDAFNSLVDIEAWRKAKFLEYSEKRRNELYDIIFATNDTLKNVVRADVIRNLPADMRQEGWQRLTKQHQNAFLTHMPEDVRKLLTEQ